MKLKSLTVHEAPYIFDVDSYPIYCTTAKLSLTSERGTPILQAKLLVRGTDDCRVFEGDRVFENGEEIGIVVYSKGFKIKKVDGTLKEFVDGPHIKLEEGTADTCKEASEYAERTPIMFGYEGNRQFIKGWLGKYADRLLTVSGLKLDVKRLRHYSGYTTESGRDLYIGDMYRGGIIELHNYQPMVSYGDGVYENLL